MCERLENACNPKTTELPTAGAAWTEIIECRLRQASDAEEAYIAYVDARCRVARVHAMLSRLLERDVAVLRAHYTERGVATVTPTAERENRERVSRDEHETAVASLENLRGEAKDVRAVASVQCGRDDGRFELDQERRRSLRIRRASPYSLFARP